MPPNAQEEREAVAFHELKSPRGDAVPLTRKTRSSSFVDPNASPLDRAGFLSIMTMWWMQPLIRRGYKEPLQEKAIWNLPLVDQSNVLQERFAKAWSKEQARTDAANAKKEDETKHQKPKFYRALWNTTKDQMLSAITLIAVYSAFTLFQPLIIKAVIRYINGQDNMFGIDSGYGLALFLGATAFVGSTAGNFSAFLTARAGCNARMTIVNAVYQKILRLSATARRTMNSGEIITLASVDSERILEAYVIGLWSVASPTILLVLCILLGTQMNAYVGLAAAVAVALIMYQAFTTAREVGRYRRRISAISAERVKVTNEVLQGIRVIKFYGWEDAIQEKIQSVREEEVALMRRYNYLRLYNAVLMFLAPTLVNAVCFLVYVLMGNEIDVATTFVVLALTNACRMPFSIFSNASVFASEAFTSARRIGDFLIAGEVEEHSDDHLLTLQKSEITLQDASFQWTLGAPRPTLESLNLSIVPGSLTVLVGSVGSGKSSLVNAILGEMLQTQGQRTVRGDFSYASQQPWIQNQTLRENILFGESYDAQHYERVVTACQLLPDFEMLEQGDATEIGERGINLSGGQKARVSIARAMYRVRHCDFLVMDDPLSALDVHVANAVFADGLNGLAKDKTRLLVLNSHYHFLAAADRILVLQDGRIVGDGTLAELRGEFPFLGSSPRAKKSESGEEEDDDVEGEGAEKNKSSKKAGIRDQQPGADGDDTKKKKLVVDEDRNVGAVTLKTYIKYLSCCGWNGYLVASIIVALFGVTQVALFFSDWFLSRWSEGSYRSSIDEYQSIGIYLGIIAFTSIFALVRCLYYTEMCMRCSAHLHAAYIRKVILAPVTTFFDVTPVGRILNRFSRDLDQVDNPLPFFSMSMLMLFFQMAAALIVCAGTSPYVLILYAPLAVLFLYVTRYYQSSARELKRLDSISRSPFLNLVSETIHGIETIRSYKMTNKFSLRCQELLNNNGKCFFTFQTAVRWFAMRTDWLVATILGVVAILAVATKSTMGAAVAGLSLTYAAQLTSSFQRVISLVTMTENIMTCFERIAFYETLDEEGHLMKDKRVELTAIDAQWPRTGAITFDKVTMRYRPELELVLQDVSFTVNSGEKVGVCGRTGSGKSSLMSVLFRIVECTSGRVMIDGVDIATLPVQALRSKLTIIPQDPMLFSGPLRINLDPFHEKTDAELWEVLKKVHLFDVVQQWGKGLEYEVAEKGDNLSVGQRQLLCIARALIRQSKVIVMDEATANVDQESDKLIQLTVRESFAGADTTVLCIAHRLETIMHSDKILVLDAGRVMEYDSPEVLMEKPGGIFQSLVESSRAVANE
ncbi:hypothetical protein Poli38472_011794 [Pythium oligandrum]|uniref:Uncharacterized protein n=1 Tax=Pythium oligandrum TaxID=41045 RepID=A0A8K1C7Q8_PYTOL|nr:hypothetical protein Poli38472_011794 [Pythium oligandrum]|eukprot:TMW58206.1 hypothetical protein Poli38472_011794 [Pythium oligandrum]